MENTQANLFEAKPLTVGQFIDQLNTRLKPFAVKIIGEVSEVKAGPTGHMYFSLKDENGPPGGEARQWGGGAVIPCALWKSRYEIFGVDLKVGMKIIALGHAEIYAPSGRLSFICDTIELAGQGALKTAYDALLKKLEGEGLFAPERKRAIPRFARRIGVITSKQGAVIHDFLNNIGKFGFKIELIDSRVEGQLAVPDLLASIKTFAKRQIDVLVVMRGGGSLEAMLAFNNENVVRAIAGFPKPVIAAIGHDKDVPLAAMTADAMCSTPTAAANLLTQSWQEIYQTLDRHQIFILGAFQNGLNHAQTRLAESVVLIAQFRQLLAQIGSRLEKSLLQMMAGLKIMVSSARQRLETAQNTIDANNPERQLKLGYSIARAGGELVKSVKNVAIGQQIDISLADGIINSQVKAKKYGRD